MENNNTQKPAVNPAPKQQGGQMSSPAPKPTSVQKPVAQQSKPMQKPVDNNKDWENAQKLYNGEKPGRDYDTFSKNLSEIRQWKKDNNRSENLRKYDDDFFDTRSNFITDSGYDRDRAHKFFDENLKYYDISEDDYYKIHDRVDNLYDDIDKNWKNAKSLYSNIKDEYETEYDESPEDFIPVDGDTVKQIKENGYKYGFEENLPELYRMKKRLDEKPYLSPSDEDYLKQLNHFLRSWEEKSGLSVKDMYENSKQPDMFGKNGDEYHDANDRWWLNME